MDWSNFFFQSEFCGIEQSIYGKCDHNITYGTLDFNVPLPPAYYGEIWDYLGL